MANGHLAPVRHAAARFLERNPGPEARFVKEISPPPLSKRLRRKRRTNHSRCRTFIRSRSLWKTPRSPPGGTSNGTDGRRACIALVEGGLVAPDEAIEVKRVLDAAALTYVASTLTSVLTLLDFLFRSG